MATSDQIKASLDAQTTAITAQTTAINNQTTKIGLIGDLMQEYFKNSIDFQAIELTKFHDLVIATLEQGKVIKNIWRLFAPVSTAQTTPIITAPDQDPITETPTEI